MSNEFERIGTDLKIFLSNAPESPRRQKASAAGGRECLSGDGIAGVANQPFSTASAADMMASLPLS